MGSLHKTITLFPPKSEIRRRTTVSFVPLQSLLLWYYNSCTVGYSDFNYLVLLDRWWLQNWILRHLLLFLHFFGHFCIQSWQKVLKWINIIFAILLHGVPKYAKFDADFEFWEIAAKKMHAKKLSSKMWWKNEDCEFIWLCAKFFCL